MKINILLNRLKKAIKNNDKKEKNKIEQQIIHPDDGAYFAIYARINGSNEWIRRPKLFETKLSAELEMRDYARRFYNNPFPKLYDKYEIRRVVVHETDITNYL